MQQKEFWSQRHPYRPFPPQVLRACRAGGFTLRLNLLLGLAGTVGKPVRRNLDASRIFRKHHKLGRSWPEDQWSGEYAVPSVHAQDETELSRSRLERSVQACTGLKAWNT